MTGEKAFTGKYQLITRHSMYEIDYDQNTVVRTTVQGAQMRQDGFPIVFENIGTPVVGEGLEMALRPLGRGFATIRYTTDVISHEPVK